MGKDLGQVVTDGTRVKRGDERGTVRRVMSDRRSIVTWDDKTSSIVCPKA